MSVDSVRRYFSEFVTYAWIPCVIVVQTVWLLTPLLWTKLWTEHYAHGNKLYATFRETFPFGHMKFAVQGGWRFLVLYMLGWILVVGALVHKFQFEQDFALSGTAGIVGQAMMSSSFLVYNTGHIGVPKRDSFVFRAFVMITLNLALLGGALAILASSEEDISFSVLSGACILSAISLTHGLGGRSYHGAQKYKFFQPFVGGDRYVWYQMISWAALAACLLLLSVTLLCKIGSCLPMPTFLQREHLSLSAGASGLVAELTMVFSIIVFEAPEFKAGIPTEMSKDRSNSLENDRRPRKFSQDPLNKLILKPIHEKVYPKDTNYFWYRNSRFRKNVGNSSTPLSSKYLKCVFLAILSGIAGSGQITWLIMYVSLSTTLTHSLSLSLSFTHIHTYTRSTTQF